MPLPFYADWVGEKLAPRWLQGPYGKKWSRTIGYQGDLVLNAVQQAVGARFPRSAPDDALAYLGIDRDMDRYPGDSDAGYRARIEIAWSTWAQAGTYSCLMGQLHAFGFVNAEIYDARAASPPVSPWPPSPTCAQPSWWMVAWPPAAGSASALWWSRFWIVLSEPFPASLNWHLRTWGDGGTWGRLGADGTPYSWGSTATLGQVASLRAIAEKWKPVHALCAGLWIVYAAGTTLRWQGRADGLGS